MVGQRWENVWVFTRKGAKKLRLKIFKSYR